MNEVRQLNSTGYSEAELDRLAFLLVGRISNLHVVEKPMRREEAAAFVQYGIAKFDTWVRVGKFKAHRLEPNADPLFLPSELLEAIKKS